MCSPHLSGDECKLRKGSPEDYSSGLPSFLPPAPALADPGPEAKVLRVLALEASTGGVRCARAGGGGVIALCSHCRML